MKFMSRNKVFDLSASNSERIPILCFLLGSIGAAILMSINLSASEVSEEQIKITTFDQIELAGTLTKPKNMKALFIPIHGSFVQTRDGDLDGSKQWMFPDGVPKRKLFIDISNALINEQIGSFRYDKRASGESGGSYPDTDLITLARDASEALKAMRDRFPGIPIGFIAQSEGCLVVLREYFLGEKPDFIVFQGPPLENFVQQFEYQKRNAAAKFLDDVDGILARRLPYLTAFYHALFYGDLLDKLKNTNDDYYTLRLGHWSYTTSLRKYRQYDMNGYEMLKDVASPVLVLIGEKDGNVSPEPVRRIISEKRNGLFSNVEARILPDLEHSFREIGPGETFVEAMAKPLSQIYIKAITEYFNEMNTTCESELSI